MEDPTFRADPQSFNRDHITKSWRIFERAGDLRRRNIKSFNIIEGSFALLPFHSPLLVCPLRSALQTLCRVLIHLLRSALFSSPNLNQFIPSLLSL